MPRVVIIGGYGVFGSRVAERLAREADLDIVIAGRSGERAREAAAKLGPSAKARLAHAAIDATRVTKTELEALRPGVIINASGPFQQQDYGLARASIDAKCHYIDLADARRFVTGIGVLDAAAKAAGVLVVSGASTVPGLSSAVVRAYESQFSRLTGLEVGISPGNSFDPGEATTASILSYVGKPIVIRAAPRERTVFGWQGIGWQAFPGLGKRWLGHVEVPDLDLFPEAYPELEHLVTRAGVEVGMFHLGMWSISWMVRLGLLRRPERLARPLLAMKHRLSFLGTDQGGMFVAMSGLDHEQRPLTRYWHLVARGGQGPYVPAMASVILAKRLVHGTEKRTGAMPCFGLFTREEFLAEVADLDIRTETAVACKLG